MIYVPKENIGTVLSVPSQKALYDFNASAKIDFSGNGFTLSRTAPPLLDLDLLPGRKGKRLTGTTDDIDTIGTSLIGDSDHFYVWAWVYVKKPSDTTQIFGRGKDGSGTGWSVGFSAGSGGTSLSIVLVNPSTLQWTATNTTPLKQGWNFVAGIVQNTYGAEPSHVSAILENSQTRTGLTGHTQLRSSTIGSFVGAGANQGTSRSQNPIGAFGVRVINGYTEAQALAEIQLIRRLTEPQFRTPEKQTFLFKGASSSTTTVTVDAGTLTLTGQSATNTVTAAVGAGTVTLTGQSVALQQQQPVTAGSTSLTGQSIGVTITVPISPGTLSLTGSDVTVVPPSGSVSVAVDPGTLTLTGQSVTSLTTVPVSAASSSLTGQNIGVTTTITVEPGSITLTGQAVAVNYIGTQTITVDPGTLSLSGRDVTVTVTGGTKGGIGKGKNFTLKQKKKLKQVVNQEWLKAEQTVQELLLDRLGHAEPAKVKIEKLTASKSLADVIEALKALSKETVTLPEQQAVIKTINKTIVEKTTKPAEKVSDIEERLAKFEKRLVDIEEMVLVVMSEIM